MIYFNIKIQLCQVKNEKSFSSLNKALFFMPEKVEHGMEREGETGAEGTPSVPESSGTRKKSVPLFGLSCSTAKKAKNPYAIRTFTTYCTKWNKWNNKYKKYTDNKKIIYV